MEVVDSQHGLILRSETSNVIVTFGKIKRFLGLVDLHTSTIFIVVVTFSVTVLIKMNFMDKYVAIIYPTGRPLRPPHSKPVGIFSTGARRSWP